MQGILSISGVGGQDHLSHGSDAHANKEPESTERQLYKINGETLNREGIAILNLALSDSA